MELGLLRLSPPEPGERPLAGARILLYIYSGPSRILAGLQSEASTHRIAYHYL